MQVIITGANRGIGEALFTRYKNRGEDVIGTSRAGAPYSQLDVTEPSGHQKFAASLGARSIDLLICNAGVYLDKGQELETGFPADDWATTMATNVAGVFLTVQSLLPKLRAANSAKIAIISSMMGSQSRAPGGSYIYRASKAAALNVGRNLAADLEKDGISVGIYHPGWVSTDMGGEMAPVTVDQSADGLVEEFDRLSLKTTGCFRTFDGQDQAF